MINYFTLYSYEIVHLLSTVNFVHKVVNICTRVENCTKGIVLTFLHDISHISYIYNTIQHKLYKLVHSS